MWPRPLGAFLWEGFRNTLLECQLVLREKKNCQEIKEFGNPIPERQRPCAKCFSEALHFDLRGFLGQALTESGLQNEHQIL